MAAEQVGRYQLRDVLGQGGMGVVYRAYDPLLERYVALKLLNPVLTGDEQAKVRFRREASLAARLRHPGIVTIYDVGEQGDRFFITMELLSGESLEQRLQQRGHLGIDEAVGIFSQVAAALDYAHQHGVVHRDIKPANVMLTDEVRVALTDFGLAKSYADSDAGLTQMTMPGTVFGTPYYIAPEQIEGRKLDQRADIYSLAVVLYQMLCGTVPFGGSMGSVLNGHLSLPPPPPQEYNPLISEPLAAAVTKGLAKQPEQRYQTAAEFSRAVQAAMLPHPLPPPDYTRNVPSAMRMPPTPTPSPYLWEGSAAPLAPTPSPSRWEGSLAPPPAGEAGRGGAARGWWLVGTFALLAVIGLATWLILAGVGGTKGSNSTTTPAAQANTLATPTAAPTTQRTDPPAPPTDTPIPDTPVPLATAPPPPVEAIAEQWDGLQGSATHEGYKASEFAVPPMAGWSNAGVGLNGPITQPPTVYQGRVLVTSDGDGLLYALDSQRGRVLWSGPRRDAAAIGAVRFVPFVDNGLVYAGGASYDNGDYPNKLFMMRLDDGNLVNTLVLSNALTADPLFDTGTKLAYLALDNGTLQAWRLGDTPELVWSFDLRASDGPSGKDALMVAAPGVRDDWLYAGDNAGFIHALLADTGAERWKRSSGAGISVPPIAAPGGVIYGTDKGAVFALMDKGDSAAEDWRKPEGDDRVEGLALDSQNVLIYVVQGGGLSVLNTDGVNVGRYPADGGATCADVGVTPTPATEAGLPLSFSNSPLIVGNLLFAVADSGCIVALRRDQLNNGVLQRVWYDNVGGAVRGMAAGAKYLYVGGDSLHALGSGQPATTPTPTPATSPTPSGGG